MSAADLKGMVDGYRRLSTANVSDGLDRAGIAGAPHGIGPLWDGCGKIVGPAATLKLVPVGEADESPVLGTLEAIKRGNPGDVLVIDQGGRMDVNSYGGVAGFTTRQFGLVGTVIDGVTRDIDEYKNAEPAGLWAGLHPAVDPQPLRLRGLRHRRAARRRARGAGRHHRRRRERGLRRTPRRSAGRGAGATRRSSRTSRRESSRRCARAWTRSRPTTGCATT